MDTDQQTNSFKKVGEILVDPFARKSPHVNNVDNTKSNNVNTLNVNVTPEEKEQEIQYNARHVAEELHDLKSLNFYRKCFREHQAAFIYQCLSITKTAEREGKITTTPARYFVGVFKKLSGKK